MKLWLPSFLSMFIYFCFGGKSTETAALGADEVLHPIFLYLFLGTYISSISGFEHNRSVREGVSE